MAEFPALPLWTDALIADTTHLTPAQFGAYLRLLIVAWRAPDCALPNDDTFLGRVIGEPRSWPRLKTVVLSFFDLGTDNKWRQKRLSNEYKYVTAKRAQQRTSGRASALKRKKTRSTNVAPPLQPPHPHPYPITKSPSDSLSMRIFDEQFWPIAVRKTGKGAARKAFETALTKVSSEVLLAAWVTANSEWRNWPRAKIPHPRTWLYQERWGDDAPTREDADANKRPHRHGPVSKTRRLIEATHRFADKLDERRGRTGGNGANLALEHYQPKTHG